MLSTREILVNDLVKTYKGGVTAVDGVSFEVSAGQVFGFLGPNGAGKSTVIRILTTLGLPTSGSASVGGFDVTAQADSIRRIAGVALQDVGLDPLMKPLELLTMQGRLFGMDTGRSAARADELLRLVRLEDAVDRRVGTYSGGMRRRLDLAMALVHEPEILFLDEPTTGLDPASRRDVWTEVRRLNRSLGMTIFLTTQYLEEADELADVVAIINKGRIAAQDTPAALKSTVGNESINLDFPDSDTAKQAVTTVEDLAKLVQLDRSSLRLYLKGAAQAVPGVMNRLQQADLHPLSLTLTQPTLDDVFLKVTGERLETETAPQA
jgi:ABC-2 type transport system ATP-binding protein